MLKGLYLTLMMSPDAQPPEAVSRDVIEALNAVQVTQSSGQRSGFQLTFGLGKRSPLNLSLFSNGYFDPKVRVVLTVTVNGIASVLMDGVITQQQVGPSNEPGQSSLTITGEDLTRLMDILDRSGKESYQNLPPDARVQKILAQYAVLGVRPTVIRPQFNNTPSPQKSVPQHVGTDFRYINKLADDVGHVFYLDPGPVGGQSTAYWGPEVRSASGTVQPALTVNMDAYSNVESLNFSYDGFAKTSYTISVQDADTGKPTDTPVPDTTQLSPLLGARKIPAFRTEKLTVPDDFSPTTAMLYATAKAVQAADVISATGQLDVLRYGRVLQSRQLVGVRGAGMSYDGLYYVKSVTHNIKRGEYKQSFTLSRNAMGSSVANLVV